MHVHPLFRSGPPTALVLTGDWRAVVATQRQLAAAHAGTTFVHVRATRMRTAAGCFDELAAALQFPVWFGANWDALIDVVRDRDWLPATVLAIYDAHELLRDAAERDRRNLADVLERCNQAGAFHVLAQVSADERAPLLDRWRAAGLTIDDLAPPAP